MHAPLYGYNQTNVPIEPSSIAETNPIRSNFITSEGVYRQMTVNEFFRTNRIQNQMAGPACNSPVRVSFLKIHRRKLSYAEEALPLTSEAQNGDMRIRQSNEETDYIERICFNIGREIYVFDSDLSNPSESAKIVDKRVYKGTFPTCHDFKQTSATLHACELLVGFSAGQIQLIDPSQKEMGSSASKLFNEDRLVDKTAVTCLKWVPNENSLFAASHISGNLYFYNEGLASPQMAPTYQLIKQGDDHIVYGCKAKAERNPVYRWSIGDSAINKFEFAGRDSALVAIASQDGFLRVFNWTTKDLIGFFKSYYGGILTLAWSPDLKYIATGGEDDLLNLYSLNENRVVCRGQGHRSWIAEVAFDCYASEFLLEKQNIAEEYSEEGRLHPSRPAVMLNNSYINKFRGSNDTTQTQDSASDIDVIVNSTSLTLFSNGHSNQANQPSQSKINQSCVLDCDIAFQRIIYRIGTVGHDCQLCLWDITEDLLATHFDENKKSKLHGYNKFSDPISPSNTTIIPIGIGNALSIPENDLQNKLKSMEKNSNEASKSSVIRFKKLHKRGFSIGSRLTGNDRWARHGGSASNGANSWDSTLKKGENFSADLFGTAQCPKLEDVPVIEPLVCKKISHERLGSLHFREECIVTACQEGIICSWARPNLIRQNIGHGEGILFTDGNNSDPITDNYDSTCV